MADIQSHKLSPGNTMNFSNQQAKAIRIKGRTLDGTEIEPDLHPGATLKMTVGYPASSRVHS